jgi:hypothetical protein
MSISVLHSKILLKAATRNKVVASRTSSFFAYQDTQRPKFNDAEEIADDASEESDAYADTSAASSHGYDLPASLNDMIASADDVDETVDESLSEGAEEANDFFLLLQSYLRLVPSPTDEQVHKLAESLGMSPEELEQGIYHTLSILLEDEELSEDARDLIQQNLDRQGAVAQETLADENNFIDTDEVDDNPVAVFSDAEAEDDGVVDTGVDSIDNLSERDGY